MGSRKRSAQQRKIAEFKASLSDGLGPSPYGEAYGSGLDDMFAREEERRRQAEAEHDRALRKKACESKNRYVSEGEAREAIALCAEHGTMGLRCYKCAYCGGWHLTSKQE